MPRRPPDRHRPIRASRRLRGLAIALLPAVALALALGLDADGSPDAGAVDLRLSWVEPSPPPSADRATESPASTTTLEGSPGTLVEVPYRILNLGSRDAFAFLIEAHTSLGGLGSARRREPGPGAGTDIEDVLRFPLAEGMRTLCLKVRLQTLHRDELPDPTPEDNRLCRPVSVTADSRPGGSSIVSDPPDLEPPRATEIPSSVTDPKG